MGSLGDLKKFDVSKVKVVDKRQKSIPELVKGKKVLSIGCVDMIEVKSYGEFVRSGFHQMYNMRKVAKELTGVDVNEKGINILKKEGFNVYCVDILSIDSHHDVLNNKYDVVVLSHVIEHIPDIFGFLKSVKEKFSFGEIIIAVPNAYNYYSVLNYFVKKEEVLSNDHYYTFSPITITKLGESLGFIFNDIWFDRSEPKIKIGEKYKFGGLLHSILRSTIFNRNGDLIISFKNN